MAPIPTDLENEIEIEHEATGRTAEDSAAEPGLLSHRLTRRSFLSQASAAGVVATASPLLVTEPAAAIPAAATHDEAAAVRAVPITLNINGEDHHLELDARTTLLDCLRENLNLPGTKKGCDHGQCGACTVHVNGRRVNSCLSFAVMHAGDKITTIEGLGSPEHLHPMQAAFVEHDAYQCGYCTPGQICSALGMLAEAARGEPSLESDLAADAIPLTDAEIRERMSGNICRCGAYSNIVEAISEVGGVKA